MVVMKWPEFGSQWFGSVVESPGSTDIWEIIEYAEKDMASMSV
jgi:hypothetical protein